MNQKQIGIIVLIIGVLLIGFMTVVKVREEAQLNLQIELNEESCFLDDGTCLHAERDYAVYFIGYGLAFLLIALSLYLIIFDKTQKILAEHQIKVSSALKYSKKDDKFKAFLAGFNEDEKKVLSAIKEQDGILQSTLRYRAGISKTGLSLMLKNLEEKGFISRKESGKSNQVFLKKVF